MDAENDFCFGLQFYLVVIFWTEMSNFIIIFIDCLYESSLISCFNPILYLAHMKDIKIVEKVLKTDPKILLIFEIHL